MPPQRRQRILRIRPRQVGHALLLDQITSPREQLHQPRDHLLEQARELSAGGGSRRIEDGVALGAPNHPVEHQAVQVDIEIPRRAESLDQRDAACVGGGVLQSRLPENKPLDDPVHDAQHRCEQLGMGSAAQTGRSRPLTTPDSVFPGRRHRQSPCRGRPRSATSGHSSVTAVRQPIAGGPRRSRRQSRRWRTRPLPLSALNSARTSCLRCRRTVRSSRTRRWRTWGAATARPPPPHGQPRWRSHRR